MLCICRKEDRPQTSADIEDTAQQQSSLQGVTGAPRPPAAKPKPAARKPTTPPKQHMDKVEPARTPTPKRAIIPPAKRGKPLICQGCNLMDDASGPVQEETEADFKPTPENERIDVIMACGKASCVLAKVIDGLLRYLRPQPKRILIMLPPRALDAC